MNNSISSTGSSVITTLFVFLSSACCVGPLAVMFSFVGLSSSVLLSIENIVGPFRPFILGLTSVFIGTGFYFAYRPQKEACEPGKVCVYPKSQRVQRLALWFSTALMLILLYFTYVHPNLDVLFDIYL